MLKFLAVLLLVGGGGFAYWWTQQPPQFDGISADTKVALWKYQKTEDEAEKMKLAVELKYHHLKQLALKTADDLTADERVIEAQAIQLATQVEDEVVLFESKLTRDDVDWITKDNPDSIFRVTGELPTHVSPCTEEEYQQIRKHAELRELLSRAQDVMTLNAANEQPFMKQYRARRLELLRTDNRFSEYRKAGEAYYSLYDAVANKEEVNSAEKLKANQSKSEENLEKTGLKPEETGNYLHAMAKLGPHCLTRPSPKFKESLDRDITLQRGHFLLEKLQEYMAVTGKSDVTLEDLPLDTGDPIQGSILDANSKPYELIKNPNGKLSLKSGDIVIESR